MEKMNMFLEYKLEEILNEEYRFSACSYMSDSQARHEQ